MLVASSVEKEDEESLRKANEVLTRMKELKLKAESLEKQRQENSAKIQKLTTLVSNDEQQQQKQQSLETDRDITENKKKENNVLPQMFASKGSHLLEGQAQQVILETKWGYPPGSDDLLLHRTILAQAGVAARTLESMCALEAWREYLDNFIKTMENRKDTMLYNWI